MNHIIQLFQEGRYNVISERMIEVDNQVVSKQIKKGREIITCQCENAGRFGSNQLCRHKVFFIMLPLLLKLKEKIWILEQYYEGARILNKEIKPEYILDDLKELRRFK
jgi:hypothetical protein